MVLNDEADISLNSLIIASSRGWIIAVCTLTPVPLCSRTHPLSTQSHRHSYGDQILSSRLFTAGFTPAPWVGAQLADMKQGGHFLFIRSTACD